MLWPETDEQGDFLATVANAALAEVGLSKYEVWVASGGCIFVTPSDIDRADEPMVDRAIDLAWKATEGRYR